MARITSTGILRLYYVPTISNTSAPTTAEIAAGVNLTGHLRRDGLKTPLPGKTVDGADMGSRYDKTGRGSYGGTPITAVFYRGSNGAGDPAGDEAWSTLTETTDGYFIVARHGGSGGSGALAATDTVEVWKIEVVSREMMDTADNEYQKFTSTCAVPDTPVLGAVVA